MLARDYFRQFLRPWACCRGKADAFDIDQPLEAPTCDDGQGLKNGCGCPNAYSKAALIEADTRLGRPLNGRIQLACSLLVHQESLRRSTEMKSGECIGQEYHDERLNETAIFIESMLLDMKARDLVVTTLDTAASLLPLLARSQSIFAEGSSADNAHTQDAGAISDPCKSFVHEYRNGGPAQLHQRRPCADREPSNCPTHRLPAQSDYCNRSVLDESAKLAVGSAYGMDNLAAALSAEARLSFQGRASTPLAQSHATAQPAALDSRKVTQARCDSRVAVLSSLISVYSGRAVPSASSQIGEEYSRVFSRKGANCICFIQRPAQDAMPPECADAEGLRQRPEEAFSGAYAVPSIPRRADAVELLYGDTTANVCPVPGSSHHTESDRDYHHSDARATDVPATSDADLPKAVRGAMDNNSSTEGSNTIDKGMKKGQRESSGLDKVRQEAESPVSMTPLLSILSDVGELSCMADPGILGGIWLGDWRGMRVAIKLISCARDCSDLLKCMARATRLQHPNLLTVYYLRIALVDEASLSELDPPLVLRPDWAAARRPKGRLMRFLAAYPELNAPEGDPPRSDALLTLHPGDIITPRPVMTPSRQALQSVRPRLGGSVIATVMEFCEMGNLQSLACGGESPFRARQFWSARVAQRALLRTAREVAQGMHALHAAGIVHGSLQPTNVLLSRSNADRRGFVARVADVGSVSLAYAAANPLVCGPCVALLAPEGLVNEARARTPAADVYAFGMMLFIMAAGEMPFQDSHLGAVIIAVASDGLRPQWPAGEHSHLESLFLRCLVQLPSKRPDFKQILCEICVLEQQIKGKGRGDGGRPVSTPALTAAP